MNPLRQRNAITDIITDFQKSVEKSSKKITDFFDFAFFEPKNEKNRLWILLAKKSLLRYSADLLFWFLQKTWAKQFKIAYRRYSSKCCFPIKADFS